MKTSIQHFSEKGIPQLQEMIKDFIKNPAYLAQFAENVRKIVLELGCSIISETLDECNLMLENSVKRRIHWQIKDRTQRTLLTSLGTIRFTHTRFTNKKTKERAYLLDRLLELPAHTRLSVDARAMLLEEAAQSSYRKAGECLSEPVSKETVMRTVHRLNFPERKREQEEKKRKVKRLYVEADEDHIALQFHEKKGDVKRWKGHGDNGRIVKLIYVHEGIEQKGKRNVLKNPVYFGGFCPGEKNKELWKEVDGYIKGQYEQKSLEEIRFQSDGGGWMKEGAEKLGATFVLDGFHLRKYVKRLCRLTGKEEKEEEILGWIKENKRKCLEEWSEEEGKRLGEKERKKQEEACGYLKRNWKGIQERIKEKEGNIGSSTEAHISHVLSSRMSSRPMGWSKRGAKNLSRLRIYWKNGGDMKELLVRKEEGEKKPEECVCLSAQEVLDWERRSQKRNGKYWERIQASISRQTGVRAYFQSAITGLC